MEPDTFSVGEVVVLNSGGPLMTIQEILAHGCTVRCIWINDRCAADVHDFPIACVAKLTKNA